MPGLFEQAFADVAEARSGPSVIIGDSLSDMEAGRNAGMSTIFIEGEADRRKAGSEKAMLLADAVAASLSDAVDRYF